MPRQSHLRLDNSGKSDFVDPIVESIIGRKGDARSRHNWSMAVAAIMVCNWPISRIHTAVGQGEDKFVSYCRQYLHGHGFHADDLRRVFRVLEKASSMNQDRARQFVNNIIVEASRG